MEILLTNPFLPSLSDLLGFQTDAEDGEYDSQPSCANQRTPQIIDGT